MIRNTTRHWGTHLIILVLVALVATSLGIAAGTQPVEASSDPSIEEFDVPDEAASGSGVMVSASAATDEQLDNTLVLHVFWEDPDTGDVNTICTDTVSLSGEGTKSVSCEGSFEMLDEDVDIHARLTLETGAEMDHQEDTIASVEDPGDGGDDGGDDDGDDGGNGGGDDGDNGGNDGTGGDGDDDGLLSGSITAKFEDALKSVLVEPFRALGRTLLDIYTHVIQTFPEVDDNPAVEEIHQLTLAVTLVLGSASLMVAGILYMIGPILNVSYADVRMILPRVVLAMAFATVSLPLLQLAIDFFDVLTQVFKPDTPQFGQVIWFSIGLLVVAVIKAILLLVVVLMFVILDAFIVLVAAISPLIALAWALPKTKRYADAFISAWWASLAVSPLAMLIIRTSLSMLGMYEGQLPSWILGIAMLLLLLIVPKMLYGASQAVLAASYVMASSTKQRVSNVDWNRFKQNKTNRSTTQHVIYDRNDNEHIIEDDDRKNK